MYVFNCLCTESVSQNENKFNKYIIRKYFDIISNVVYNNYAIIAHIVTILRRERVIMTKELI